MTEVIAEEVRFNPEDYKGAEGKLAEKMMADLQERLKKRMIELSEKYLGVSLKMVSIF